jgi:light-regulated signal transduction histidine kinase (bacteriophytochrome)
MAAQRMGQLIDDFLKLSRVARAEFSVSDVDLGSLAREVVRGLHASAPQRQAEVTIADRLNARGDTHLLRIVLENLLGNAWKFTKNTAKAEIEFGAKVEGDGRMFFIKDNGAGFDMAFKDKLFGAFQRLHDAAEFPGTGIGLATVQRIVNRHGGTIRAEGAVGEGAAFYFNLG